MSKRHTLPRLEEHKPAGASPHLRRPHGNSFCFKPAKTGPGRKRGAQRDYLRTKTVDGVLWALHPTRGWKRKGRAAETNSAPGFSEAIRDFVKAVANKPLPLFRNFAALTPVRTRGAARGG